MLFMISPCLPEALHPTLTLLLISSSWFGCAHTVCPVHVYFFSGSCFFPNHYLLSCQLIIEYNLYFLDFHLQTPSESVKFLDHCF